MGGVPHNERLEFLGDAVLSIVVTEALFRDFPDLPEGRLAKMRARSCRCARWPRSPVSIGPDGLGAYLRLGRGEESTGGRDKSSILADTLEAVLGAIYLDRARGRTGSCTRCSTTSSPRRRCSGAALDWKTSLQELTAELGLGVPEYQIDSEGPDHERRFTARAVVAGRSSRRARPEQEGSRAGRGRRGLDARSARGAGRVAPDRSRHTPSDRLRPPCDVRRART